MYIEDSSSPEAIITDLGGQLQLFVKKNGYTPRIIMIRNYGLLLWKIRPRQRKSPLMFMRIC